MCCPDNAACDTNPECIPGGTTPGVDTCCAETSLVKQKVQELGTGEVETKKQNPWKGCNPDPKCLPGVDIPGVDNCCKNCEPGVPTPGVDDCGVARKRMWARSMRKNGMKNDQINEVIQKESKHTEQTAEEKEQNRQQFRVRLLREGVPGVGSSTPAELLGVETRQIYLFNTIRIKDVKICNPYTVYFLRS